MNDYKNLFFAQVFKKYFFNIIWKLKKISLLDFLFLGILNIISNSVFQKGYSAFSMEGLYGQTSFDRNDRDISDSL